SPITKNEDPIRMNLDPSASGAVAPRLCVFPFDWLTVGLGPLVVVVFRGFQRPSPGRSYLGQPLALGGRLVPSLSIIDVQEQPGVSTHQAAAVGLSEGSPTPRVEREAGRLLPAAFLLRFVLVVALNDPGVSLPACTDDLVDGAMGKATAPVQAEQHVVADI